MEFNKKELLEVALRDWGFGCNFWSSGGSEGLNVVGGGVNVGQVWWLDGSVVWGRAWNKVKDFKVDLTDPKSLEQIRDYFKS